MRSLGLDENDEKALEQFCETVYDRIKKTLYCNIVRILLTDKYPRLLKNGPDNQLRDLIEQSWEESKTGSGSYFQALFCTKAALIGIGAPTHIFLPDVAKALNTEFVAPENAGVANATGAIVGNISVTSEVEVHTDYTPAGISGYTVHAADKNYVKKRKQDALDIALSEAKRQALDEARRRGIAGDIRLQTEIISSTGTAFNETTLDLGCRVIATAIGGIML